MNFNLDRTWLVKTIKAEDEKGGNPDHHFDESEFINVVLSTRDLLRSAIENDSVAKGLVAAAAEIKRWQEHEERKPISALWSLVTRHRKVQDPSNIVPRYNIDSELVLTHEFGGYISPHEVPLIRNATQYTLQPSIVSLQ